MNKYTLYTIGIAILVILFGSIMIKSEVAANNPAIVNGEAQEVVIGMRDYNYYPNTIRVEAGKPVRISLDSSVTGCFRDFTIKDFGIHKYLATPEDTVEFTPAEKGTYTFACSMGMGTGVLIVE